MSIVGKERGRDELALFAWTLSSSMFFMNGPTVQITITVEGGENGALQQELRHNGATLGRLLGLS